MFSIDLFTDGSATTSSKPGGYGYVIVINGNKFSYGIGSRNTSVRIGYKTYEDKKGYFEDRRPSSNMDPYVVCSKIAETILI